MVLLEDEEYRDLKSGADKSGQLEKEMLALRTVARKAAAQAERAKTEAKQAKAEAERLSCQLSGAVSSPQSQGPSQHRQMYPSLRA